MIKIHELITMLQKYDSQAEVVGTWEGEVQDLDVYQAADGRVMVDADNNNYKAQWQNCICEVCGDITNGKPRCWQHND